MTTSNKTATNFLAFIEREGIDNKNGLLRAERFDSEFAGYELQDNTFILTKHNGQVLTISALELFGKCQLPSQLPLGNGRIDSALDGKTQERKTVTEKAPTTPKQALMADIKKAVQSEAAAIAERAKEFLAIPSHIDNELLDSYYNIVEQGRELVIDGLVVDTSDTISMIGKEKLSKVIESAENCFAGLTGVSVTVEPNDTFSELAVMVQHFNEADKDTVDNKLSELFGAKCAKWQIISAFKTAIINIKLPKVTA